jgi:hypothetical protein
MAINIPQLNIYSIAINTIKYLQAFSHIIYHPFRGPLASTQ